MTYEQILTKIAEDSASYDEFKKYIDDAGWELWMDDFCEGDEPTEAENKKLEAIQKEGWNRSHVVQMGYGFHGGGRPKADKTKCKNLNIRIMEDKKIELQEKARLEGLTVTEYILNALKFYYNREIERRIGK